MFAYRLDVNKIYLKFLRGLPTTIFLSHRKLLNLHHSTTVNNS
jgi:hypothetical protein